MEKGSSIIYAVSLLMIWNFSTIDGFINSCSEVKDTDQASSAILDGCEYDQVLIKWNFIPSPLLLVRWELHCDDYNKLLHDGFAIFESTAAGSEHFTTDIPNATKECTLTTCYQALEENKVFLLKLSSCYFVSEDIQPTVAIDLQTSQSVDSLQSNHHFTITSPELYEYYSSHNLLPVESLAGVVKQTMQSISPYTTMLPSSVVYISSVNLKSSSEISHVVERSSEHSSSISQSISANTTVQQSSVHISTHELKSSHLVSLYSSVVEQTSSLVFQTSSTSGESSNTDDNQNSRDTVVIIVVLVLPICVTVIAVSIIVCVMWITMHKRQKELLFQQSQFEEEFKHDKKQIYTLISTPSRSPSLVTIYAPLSPVGEGPLSIDLLDITDVSKNKIGSHCNLENLSINASLYTDFAQVTDKSVHQSHYDNGSNCSSDLSIMNGTEGSVDETQYDDTSQSSNQTAYISSEYYDSLHFIKR